MHKRTAVWMGAIGALLAATVLPAQAQQVDDHNAQINVDLQVLPIAELTFPAGNLLYLEIPPGASTAPSSGVEFAVTGNADASLIAEPDAFVQVGSQYMGKAVLGDDAVGYKLELRFPDTGASGSPIAIASLPGSEPGPTTPALTVDLTSTGQQRTGVLHMEADANWTSDGAIPAPGIYVGEVTMTVTASD